mgnify:CR=1 FL=1
MGKTKYDLSKESKKKAWEEGERIDWLGQDSERKGAKAVIEENKELEKKEYKKTAEQLTKLNDIKRNEEVYRQRLRVIGQARARKYDIPKGFLWTLELTSKGIVLWIADPKRRTYARGMKISGNPLYDLNGIDRLIDKGLTFIDGKEIEYAKPIITN